MAELNRYLPNPQAPRNQDAMTYLFQLWEQLHDAAWTCCRWGRWLRRAIPTS